MSGLAVEQSWFAADAPLLVEVDLPNGRCVAALRASPTRAADEPCEDAAAVVAWPAGACALVVADGVGGVPDGDVAAATVVRSLAKGFRAAPADGQQLRAAAMASIEDANRQLLERPGGAATTVLCAIVDRDELRSCHAGDSELLVVGQRGRIKHRTISHSPVGYAVEAGMLDAREGFVHEDRYLLSNCVGMSGMRVEVASAIRLAPRDTVVLASDGLWDNLRVEEVVEFVRKGPLARAAARLIERASARMGGGDRAVAGKPDDLSVLLYRSR